MRPSIVLLPMLLLPLLAGRGARAAEDSAPKHAALNPLAKEYAQKREALLKDAAEKRRALLESPAFKASSPAERKALLDALLADAKKRDAGLTEEYDAKLRRGRSARDAGQARAQLERDRRLDELRARAAQDARRAKTP